MDRGFRALWGVTAVLAAAAVAWVATDRWSQHELAVARRALDARFSELTQRALAPGSSLSCLDAIVNATVEAACEKALFASPEATAAAVAYADARLTLLADGVAHAVRDPDYAPALERLRRGLEADRYGVVAQALVSRGCTAEACPVLKLLHDPQRVAANLKERTFDANVVLNASLWRPEGAALAAAPAATLPPPSLSATGAATTATPSGKFEYPSAASIPPVSIMTPEPPLSKQEETALAPAPAAAPPARPQPARRPPRDTTGQAAPNVPLPLPAQR